MQMYLVLHFFLSKGAGFFLHLLHFFLAFFLHLSCLQFPFIVAIHGQVFVTCTILTRGAGANAFICIAFFAVST